MRTSPYQSLLFAALALAGCSSPEPLEKDPASSSPTSAQEDVGPEDGSRLRSTFIHGEDGSKVSRGLHDTALGFDCAFRENLETGAFYCVPTATAEHVAYADPACTVEAFEVRALGVCAQGGPGRRHATRTGSTCGAPQVVEVEWRDTTYDATSNGCEPSGYGGWVAVRTLTPEELVKGTTD